MKQSTHQHSGFTLVELLVTVAILAIIAAMAAPALGVFASRSAMRGISADFTLGMQRARTEAINRNECVVICMSSNGTSCATSSTSGSNWGIGWIAFRSPTCDVAAPSAGDIFLVREGFSTRYQLNSADSSAKRSVVFNARGNTGSSTMGKFNLVDTGVSSNDVINRTFCLDKAGRVRTLEYAETC